MKTVLGLNLSMSTCTKKILKILHFWLTTFRKNLGCYKDVPWTATGRAKLSSPGRACMASERRGEGSNWGGLGEAVAARNWRLAHSRPLLRRPWPRRASSSEAQAQRSSRHYACQNTYISDNCWPTLVTAEIHVSLNLNHIGDAKKPSVMAHIGDGGRTHVSLMTHKVKVVGFTHH